MNNTMEYRGYVGSIEFSETDCILYGRILGVRDLISYEGESAKELLEDFHNAVDGYIRMCEENNKKPEKAYKGSFNVRFSPDLHRRAAIQAIAEGISLNSFIEKAVAERLATEV